MRTRTHTAMWLEHMTMEDFAKPVTSGTGMNDVEREYSRTCCGATPEPSTATLASRAA